MTSTFAAYICLVVNVDLLRSLERTLHKTKVQELAAVATNGGYSIKDVLDITFHDRAEIAFRAAWITEYIALHYPDGFFPYTGEFIRMYSEQRNQSCRRHYTKIMLTLLQKGELIGKFNLSVVVEATFEWLIDAKTPVAVKANCLDILYMLRKPFPWIADELHAQIEFLLKDGGPALQARGRRILKQLK